MYRALYRKWRPQRFEDVVGQTAIVAALKNQVAAERVGHAYLFTGVRGTGKTTCAKIFAKAVNCQHPQNGDPCGECAACRGIDNGSILDVVEMDAASNNGVDDIRDIRDETSYTPSMCRYKVYIIDEVHMLSGAAFNALLKTLEEPPAHVIFILATTEIQKVPATILSRCQRYDFTRITPDDIAGRVAYIAGQESLALTDGAAALIARLADGALRDALSILDTCAGVTTNIDEDVVRRMAGVTDKSYLFRISDAIAAEDGVTALAQLAELRQRSVDVKRLSEELINHYRSLMLAGLPGGKALLTGVSPEEEALYLDKAHEVPQGAAIRAIRTLGSALERMTRGNDQRIELELAVFSLCEPPAAATQVISAAPVQSAPATQRFAAVTAAQPFASAPAVVQPFAAAAAPAMTPAGGPAFAAGTPTTGISAKPAASTSAAQVGVGAAVAPVPSAAERFSNDAHAASSAVSAALGIAAGPNMAPAPASAAPDDDRLSLPEAPPEQQLSTPADDDRPPLPDAPPPPVDAPLQTDGSALPWESEPAAMAPAEIKQRPAPAAKPQATAQPPAPQVQTPGAPPAAFAHWDEVVRRLSELDPMLYTYLRRSRGYSDGKRILIDGGKMFNQFLRENRDSQKLIKKVIAEVTGQSYGIGPYDPAATAKKTASNAEQSLDLLRQRGLNVEIRDTEAARRG